MTSRTLISLVLSVLLFGLVGCQDGSYMVPPSSFKTGKKSPERQYAESLLPAKLTETVPLSKFAVAVKTRYGFEDHDFGEGGLIDEDSVDKLLKDFAIYAVGAYGLSSEPDTERLRVRCFVRQFKPLPLCEIADFEKKDKVENVLPDSGLWELGEDGLAINAQNALGSEKASLGGVPLEAKPVSKADATEAKAIAVSHVEGEAGKQDAPDVTSTQDDNSKAASVKSNVAQKEEESSQRVCLLGKGILIEVTADRHVDPQVLEEAVGALRKNVSALLFSEKAYLDAVHKAHLEKKSQTRIKTFATEGQKRFFDACEMIVNGTLYKTKF